MWLVCCVYLCMLFWSASSAYLMLFLLSKVYLLFQATYSYKLAQYTVSYFWACNKMLFIGFYLRFSFPPECWKIAVCNGVTFSSTLKTLFVFLVVFIPFSFHSSGSDKFNILLAKRNAFQSGVIADLLFL